MARTAVSRFLQVNDLAETSSEDTLTAIGTEESILLNVLVILLGPCRILKLAKVVLKAAMNILSIDGLQE
jgi:hypothetical protein